MEGLDRHRAATAADGCPGQRKSPVPAPAEAPPTHDTDDIARQLGFVQCASALQRTLTTTPAGWALVVWMCWGTVPLPKLSLWLCGFALIWAGSLWWLRGVTRRGPLQQRDTSGVLVIATLDGAAWGSSVGLLMGFDRVLDPWLAAVLCGVSAVNAPVYITFMRAYRFQMGGLWLATMAGALLSTGPHPVLLEGTFGLSVFLGLLVYYMNPIAQRVLEGIRLQLTNAQLAQQLRETLALVRHDASTDALTGQPNRRALDVLLLQQIETAVQHGLPLSVLLLDIDHFKRVNDVYGHGVGDDALRAFARRVRGLLREHEVCARYGGEEFVVVLPDTPLPLALQVAERLRHGVAQSPLLQSPPLPATVSIGAAQLSAGQTAAALLEAADQAVYAAKRAGRNQVQPDPDRHPGDQPANAAAPMIHKVSVNRR
jgi:diguanylate cyclase (GGDEF)-like protein